MFVDEVSVTCKAGDGGRGCSSFRRERFVPKGGPDGGDGGRGGSIYLICDASLNNLNFFRYNPLHRAGRGRHGQGALKHGRDGEDIRLALPAGTLAMVDGDVAWESREGTAPFCIAAGGRGGFGNAHYKSPIRRAPRFAQDGFPGQEVQLRLQLKLIADCGLVGLPNAGKSTLISSVSSAHPKIADYPFTTLEPHLGVVVLGIDESFVMADIPGLIPDAHLGAGLGNRFLKHIERTRVLLYLIDISESSGREPVEDFNVLRRELGCYGPALLSRPALIAASKIDILANPDRLHQFTAAMHEMDYKVYPISAATGKGLKPLVKALYNRVQGARSASAA